MHLNLMVKKLHLSNGKEGERPFLEAGRCISQVRFFVLDGYLGIETRLGKRHGGKLLIVSSS